MKGGPCGEKPAPFGFRMAPFAGGGGGQGTPSPPFLPPMSLLGVPYGVKGVLYRNERRPIWGESGSIWGETSPVWVQNGPYCLWGGGQGTPSPPSLPPMSLLGGEVVPRGGKEVPYGLEMGPYGMKVDPYGAKTAPFGFRMDPIACGGGGQGTPSPPFLPPMGLLGVPYGVKGVLYRKGRRPTWGERSSIWGERDPIWDERGPI